MAKKRKLAPIISNDYKNVRGEIRKKMPRLIANEAKNEFTQNFTRQGFRDVSTKKWKQRKGNTDPGRGILIGKGSGKKLFRSIRTIKASQRRIVVGSTVHYAGVHNYGLRAGRGRGFQMPKRQFIGHSRILSSNIRKLILKHVNKSFDK